MTHKQDPHQGMHLTSVISKEIMGIIRNGDYQHPGEEEAIELLFQKIEKSPEFFILDVGCGYGGTASYVQNKDWGKVVGIDINKEVVNIAKYKYKLPFFVHADVISSKMAIESELHAGLRFDIIYLFNSFFLFPDHKLSLQQLALLAKSSTKLLIFDYVDYGEYASHAYTENGKKLLPNIIKLNEINDVLMNGGWEVESTSSVDDLYITWYQDLMQKIDEAKTQLCEKYGSDIYASFTARYQHILDALQAKVLGGIIITATLKSESRASQSYTLKARM